MKLQHALPRRSPLAVFQSAALVLFLALSTAAPALAQSLYLAAGKPDGIALLPPPPASGSVEEAADLSTVRAVFKGRTSEELARATKDASLSFSLFARAIGPSFQPAQLPKTEALLKRVKKDIGEIINAPKNHWKRTRPYLLDPSLALGAPETSFSYPSGHSTRGTVYAAVLAELFPDKKEAILAVGREIGWDRVLIGKHFLTDIYAGRVLGKAIFNELMASPAFQKDLAEAKAELQAAPAAAAAAR
jgi:acid phosphatase (class A)